MTEMLLTTVQPALSHYSTKPEDPTQTSERQESIRLRCGKKSRDLLTGICCLASRTELGATGWFD